MNKQIANKLSDEREEKIMGTTLRPEISERNKYWIEKHRYYELRHFCLQYPIWKKAYAALDGSSSSQKFLQAVSKNHTVSDPVAKCAEAKLYYSDRMKMIETTAKDTSEQFAEYILKAVTEGLSYTYLKTKMNIPCGKDAYYELYRRFFWLLNKARD